MVWQAISEGEAGRKQVIHHNVMLPCAKWTLHFSYKLVHSQPYPSLQRRDV